MATTTNYGWTTPDDTALVKDGASAIRSLGTSIDTTTKNLNPSTTLGDIEYRSSTSNTNTRLAIGTAGQILTVSGGVPAWANPTAKVVQVVNATYSTETSSSSSTFADTGLTATITPQYSDSKILVLVSQNGVGKQTNNTQGQFRLLRGATTISNFETYAGFTNSTASNFIGGISLSYLDSPATTSATTYKTQFMSNGNNTSVFCQVSISGTAAMSTITLLEVRP